MKQSSHTPPKLAQKLLKRVIREDFAEEILGDLEQDFYQTLQNKNVAKARRHYWYQTLHYFRPFALRSTLFKHIQPFFMFTHHVKFAFRQFRREKFTFLINLIGLSTGMAATLLIALWVWDEWKHDSFHENGDHLYQVLQRVPVNDQETLTWEWTTGILTQTLKEEYPEVDLATHMVETERNGILVNGDQRIVTSNYHVEKDFFHMFSFPLLKGNKEEVLANKRSVVLSRDCAIKLFGGLEGVLGQTIEWEGRGEEMGGLFNVSGIVENPPPNSTLKYEALFSYELYLAHKPEILEWRNSEPFTFITLHKDVDASIFEQKIEGLIQRKLAGASETLFLQPFQDRYLFDQFENGQQAGGRITYVRLFSGIAFFILLIACINFMNLSTAKATLRLKEIGVKKTLGANKQVLVGQYISESLLLTLLAFLLSILWVGLFLPQFNSLSGKELQLTWDLNLFYICLSIILITGFLAGSYPAFYLSRFHPALILKGKRTHSSVEMGVRKGLVVFQFALSILFMVGVGVIYKQIQYIHSKNLGFDKENILVLEKVGNLEENMETFLTEVKQIPGVKNASTMDTDMIGNYGHTTALFWEGHEQEENPIRFGVIIGGKELIETLDIELLAGKTFAEEGVNQGGYIFNEAAIKAMGLTDPIGKPVTRRRNEHTIVGVVKDFHFESLYQGVRPCYIRRGTYGDHVVIKMEGRNYQETLSRLEEYYQAFNPGLPFHYSFLDQNYDRLYASEARVASLSQYAAGMAILISCLGLLGLAAFTAQRRTKEIGIRKVLGASAYQIVRMLSTDFTKLVLIAICIALPLSYLLAKQWLDSFAFRMDLHWGFFLGAGTIALGIAWITLISQTFQSAQSNPVEALRAE